MIENCDTINALRKRVAYLEGCAKEDAKMIAKTADDAVRYKRQAEKAEAALTEARARLKAADRMAEEVDRLLSLEGPIWEEDWAGLARVLWRYKETGQ